VRLTLTQDLAPFRRRNPVSGFTNEIDRSFESISVNDNLDQIPVPQLANWTSS
jgi:hypothetical protein